MHSPSIPIPREQGNGWSGEKEKRDLGYGSHLGGSHPKQRPNRLDYIYTITINYNQKKKYTYNVVLWNNGYTETLLVLYAACSKAGDGHDRCMTFAFQNLLCSSSWHSELTGGFDHQDFRYEEKSSMLAVFGITMSPELAEKEGCVRT